jgi:hypothetical protein
METAGTTPAAGVAAPDLGDLVRAEGPFATIYLTTEPSIENAAQLSEQRWQAVRSQLAEEGAPESVLEAVGSLVPDAHLHGEGLAVVAAAGGALHHEHGPRPPARDHGTWAPVPSLVPLLEWRQACPPHVVVLADRRGADLVGFAASGAELRRQAGDVEYTLPKNSPGGWSQPRYQRRAENSWEHNADDVAKELTALVEQVGARLVVVAGDVRAVQLLRDALPGEVAGMLHVVDGARSGVNPLDDIAEEVAAAVGTVVERDTAAVLGKLAEELGQDDRGVEGPARTLEALAAAQVDVLVVRHDPALDRQAWFGPEPTQIGLTEDTARALGVDQPVAGPLVDVAVRAALATSATVRIVPGGTAPRDGLGAILRWA